LSAADLQGAEPPSRPPSSSKKVLVIEQGKRVGGVSVHTGTIPSKTLRETALNLSGWRERGFYGRAYRVKEEISAEDLRRRL
jgi:NAD(P) transhydrogenase